MTSFFAAATGAFWLGVLTSVSPCPLASNIAAISYLGKNPGSSARITAACGLYTLGRILSYVLLGILILTALLSLPELSQFLQKYVNRALGPVLILVGMILCDLLAFPCGGAGLDERTTKRIATSGLYGSFLLGAALAFAFCPVSAALYFGSLIPLSFNHNSIFLLPSLYGLGTALPVIGLAILVSLGTTYVGRAYRTVAAFEKWARIFTGIILILVGIYYSLVYIFHVL